jgi:ADP-ribosylglycohydrolase
MVADCLKGTSVRQAVENVRPLIPRDLARQLTNAVRLATSGVLTPETLCDELGQGWVGDEALAIAVACAIGADDLEAALLLAINHDGDTDSTGSICGNLLGAGLDWEAVPKRFVAAAPQAPLVREVVEDCHRFIHGDRSREFVDRYARRD